MLLILLLMLLILSFLLLLLLMLMLKPCLLLLVTLYFVVLYVNLRLMEAAVEFLPIPYSGPLVVILPDEEKVGQPVSLAERNHHSCQNIFDKNHVLFS